MSDTTDVLEAMRTTLRELELDHVQLAGRILQLGHDIALLENGPRKRPGRPRKVGDAIVLPIEMPQRVEGAIHEPETEEANI